jgi:peroxiredoxin Q/BCP
MKGKVILVLMLMAMEGFSQGKLKVGDAAPDFTANDQDGKKVTLSDYRGKKVILYFYPKDDTPGCTMQACNLRDNIDPLTQAGYEVLGVSGDDEASHKAFQEKYNLPFTLVADTDKSINKAYGVWVEKERNGTKYWGTARTTFIIDENGKIIEIIDNVDTKQHAGQILKL